MGGCQRVVCKEVDLTSVGPVSKETYLTWRGPVSKRADLTWGGPISKGAFLTSLPFSQNQPFGRFGLVVAMTVLTLSSSCPLPMRFFASEAGACVPSPCVKP